MEYPTLMLDSKDVFITRRANHNEYQSVTPLSLIKRESLRPLESRYWLKCHRQININRFIIKPDRDLFSLYFSILPTWEILFKEHPSPSYVVSLDKSTAYDQVREHESEFTPIKFTFLGMPDGSHQNKGFHWPSAVNYR